MKSELQTILQKATVTTLASIVEHLLAIGIKNHGNEYFEELKGYLSSHEEDDIQEEIDLRILFFLFDNPEIIENMNVRSKNNRFSKAEHINEIIEWIDTSSIFLKNENEDEE